MAPSSTSLRRICTMMGTCSTATGQISTQAMHVRQDHRVSIATCPGALPWTSSSAAAGSGAGFERGVRKFPQAQDHVARRQRRADRAGRAGFVTAAALGAGIEVQQLLPVEVGDLGDARLGLRLGNARQALRRQRIAHHQRGRGREYVLHLGKRDQRDEARARAGRETTTGRAAAAPPPRALEPERTHALGDRCADRGPPARIPDVRRGLRATPAAPLRAHSR